MGATVTTVLQTVKIIPYFLTNISFATSVVNLKEDNRVRRYVVVNSSTDNNNQVRGTNGYFSGVKVAGTRRCSRITPTRRAFKSKELHS